MPIMSIWVSPAVAAGVMLPILCAMDIFGVRAYKGRWSWVVVKPVLTGAMVGIGIGWLVFKQLSVDGLRLIIGGIAVTFVLNNWFGLAGKLANLIRRPRVRPAERPAISGEQSRALPAPWRMPVGHLMRSTS